MSYSGQAPTHSGWSFCTYCGHKIAFTAHTCPKCGAPQPKAQGHSRNGEAVSPKRYGVAVSLCGVFGMIGLHHFYLGNILHGLFDLCLFLGWTIILFGMPEASSGLVVLAMALFIIDMIHTCVVFIRLICGKERDSQGRVIAVP